MGNYEKHLSTTRIQVILIKFCLQNWHFTKRVKIATILNLKHSFIFVQVACTWTEKRNKQHLDKSHS